MFRLYPNNEQLKLIHKTFGCRRFIYNYFFNKYKEKGYQKVFDMYKMLKK